MRPWIAIASVIGVAATATGFYAVRSYERKPAAVGQTTRAERRSIANIVNATGTVRLRVGSEVRVGSQLSGIVKKLNVTVGSHVRAGQIIAEIDDAIIQARLADANAQAQVDKASMGRAQVNYERAQRLASQGLIPTQQEQDLQLALGEATARFNKSLRARDVVRGDLDYVQIKAPISGTIASVSTQEGETVAASFAAPTFVTIIGDGALQLVAMVDETDIANVGGGNSVRFTVDSFPARDFPGTVASVAPKASIISGVVNYEVTININKNAQLLKPDMTANVSIQTGQHEALLLPVEAVQRSGEQSFVLVAGALGPVRKMVAVGSKDGEMIEIKRGVSPDDNIVVPLPGSANAN